MNAKRRLTPPIAAGFSAILAATGFAGLGLVLPDRTGSVSLLYPMEPAKAPLPDLPKIAPQPESEPVSPEKEAAVANPPAIEPTTHKAVFEVTIPLREPGLTRQDFTSEIGGIESSVTSVEFVPDRKVTSRTNALGHVLFLFDASGSVTGDPTYIGTDPKGKRIDAAINLLKKLAGSKVAVGAFGDVIQLGEFNTNLGNTRDEMESIRNKRLGMTKLFEALSMAIEMFPDGDGPKHLVVFSDGQGDDLDLAEVVMAQAVAKQVKVHVAYLGSNAGVLDQISQESGGHISTVGSANELSDVYAAIAQKIEESSDNSYYRVRGDIVQSQPFPKGSKIRIPIKVKGRVFENTWEVGKQ